MKISADPSIHRHREEQIIQHVEKLLADERLRVDTTVGRRPVTAFVRDVARDDGAIELKRLMTELNVPDRELQSRMPVGKTLDVSLTQTRWLFFTQNVGRIRVYCVSPARQLLLGEEPKPLTAGEVTKKLAALPRSPVPTTIVLVSTGGFAQEAHELAERRADRSVILVEPNEAGGWSAIGPAETKAMADLFDPEGDDQKRERVLALIEETRVDLLTSGIAIDKIASRAQVPLQLVEAIVKEYARQNPGLNAKRLDGRMVLFREGSNLSAAADDPGGSMGLINKVRTLFGGKENTGKKVAFLSERKAALSQQRDRAYEEMGDLEQQESQLKEQFKEADSAITKRRVTGQMLQLRKDLERRQQLLTVLNQQINVVSTHLHNLELVQQGQTAKLPNTDEITEDAVKAEEMLADLEANTELAGSVGPAMATGMSDEEKALYEELERESGGAEEAAPEPVARKAEPKKTVEKESPREPAARAPAGREPQAGMSPSAPAVPAQTRRAEPEAG